jgi:hypothetical protein
LAQNDGTNGRQVLGIFDGRIKKLIGKTDQETTKALIEKLKIDAEFNQGFAYHEFLDKYCRDAEALSKVRAYKHQFESEVTMPPSNAALRIRSNFALIWAAAALAIDFQILPWNKSPTFRAVEKCLLKALNVIEMNKSSASPTDAPTSIVMALSEKLEKADLRKVVFEETDHSATGSAPALRPMDFGLTVKFTSSRIGCGGGYRAIATASF